jgi:hypothetical protein
MASILAADAAKSSGLNGGDPSHPAIVVKADPKPAAESGEREPILAGKS